MKKIIIFLSLFVGLSSNAGTISSGGGDVVFCQNHTALVSLDFLIARESLKKSFKISPPLTTQDSLLKISNLISEKLPELKTSFTQYLSLLNNLDYSKPYVWNEVLYDLPDVADENIERLPKLCDGFKNSSSIYQAVIRRLQKPTPQFLKGQVVFDFNRDLVSALNPLQKSFLYVHEWLWDISSDVVVNRKVNYFIHSEEFVRLSPSEVHKYLAELGLKISEIKN